MSDLPEKPYLSLYETINFVAFGIAAETGGAQWRINQQNAGVEGDLVLEEWDRACRAVSKIQREAEAGNLRVVGRRLHHATHEDVPPSLWISGRLDITQDALVPSRIGVDFDDAKRIDLGFSTETVRELFAGQKEPAKEVTPRKRNKQHDATNKSKYEQVLAVARRKWPKKETAPDFRPMAEELEKKLRNDLGFSSHTIRKLLAGQYRPAKQLGIRGLWND